MLESLFNSEYCEIFNSTYFGEHLRTAASENVFMRLRKNNKLFIRSFRFALKKQFFSTSMSETSENVCFYFMIGFFPMKFVFTYNISLVWWEINFWLTLLELIKARSKVQEKNMSCERALNFDQWKTLSENYKLMIVWLWLVYKFTENYCRLRLFSEFIHVQKRYPTCLNKIRILTWKLLVISS